MSNVVPIMATGYLPTRERERLKELWTQLAGASAEKGFADGLLEELFESQSESLRDRIHLVSASIEERKGLGVRTSHEAQKRREDIEVALQQFPIWIFSETPRCFIRCSDDAFPKSHFSRHVMTV